MKTEVINQEVEWSRNGVLWFENNTIFFDTSDGEYGPLQFPIELLEEKLQEHKQKLNNG